MIQNYIFDFEGTLANTQKAVFKAWEMTCYEMSLPRPKIEAIKLMKSWDLVKIAEVVGNNQNTSQIVATYKQNYQKIESRVTLFEAVLETLQNLKEQNKSLYIVSSKTSQALEIVTENLGIKDLFVQTVGAEDIEFAKPNPAVIELLITKYSLNKSETIMIGDTLVDIQMGQNAGVKTCGVSWGSTDLETIESFGADFTIDKISKLAEF